MYNNIKGNELDIVFKRIQSLLNVGKNKDRFFPKEDIFQLIEEQVSKLKELTNHSCIGCDSKGKELHLGDKCSFLVDVSDWESIHKDGLKFIDEKKAVFEGVIAYDDSYYAYCLDTTNDYMPSILMSCIEFGAITKLDEIIKESAATELEEDLQL